MEDKARLRREIAELLDKPIPTQAGSWSQTRSAAYKEAIIAARETSSRYNATTAALRLALNRLWSFYDLAA